MLADATMGYSAAFAVAVMLLMTVLNEDPTVVPRLA